MPPLEASRPFPTIFVGSPIGFVFLGKSDRLPFFQNFPCGVKLLGACDNKAVVEPHSGSFDKCRLCHQRNIKPMFTYGNNMRKRSNMFHQPHPTPPHLQRSIMLVCKCQGTLLAPPHYQHTLHNIEVYNRKKYQKMTTLPGRRVSR